ncbi:CHAT domain-containing protein [Mucidula mucida]|nr:CHAT domain-containing protein [Mucidula mucida]
MKASTWVHFACHGQQSIDNPVDSALLLSGQEKLKLSDIASVDLPDAELAFLSACQTAMGDDTLPAESLHLAAGMLLAGFRGVIATLWSIQDRDAPRVAHDVYGYMLREGDGRKSEDGSDEAAVALHRAVGRLRDQVGETSFLSWVPWVHFGI